MCGRYSLAITTDELSERVDLRHVANDLLPIYNVAPTTEMPVIVGADRPVARIMRWGMNPAWLRERAASQTLINARIETAAEKPSFRQALEQHRCLVPATGFFEWRKAHGKRIPFHVSPSSRSYVSFAAIYDDRDGDDEGRYVILTTAASPGLRDIHDRMPVMLTPEDEDLWLDRDLNGIEAVGMIEPMTDSELDIARVSPAVNNTRNNGPDLLRPVSEQEAALADQQQSQPLRDEDGGAQLSLFNPL